MGIDLGASTFGISAGFSVTAGDTTIGSVATIDSAGAAMIGASSDGGDTGESTTGTSIVGASGVNTPPIGTAKTEGVSTLFVDASPEGALLLASGASVFSRAAGAFSASLAASSFFQNLSLSVQLVSSAGFAASGLAASGLVVGFSSLFQNFNLSSMPSSCFGFGSTVMVFATLVSSPVAAPAVPSGTTSPRTLVSKSFSKSKITRRCSTTLPAWRI